MRKTEITVQVFDKLLDIEKVLTQKGYHKKEEYCLRDHYFTKFEDAKIVDYKTLLASSILIRTIEEDEKITQCMIYKNKTLDENGNVSSEEKIRVKIDDGQKGVSILKSAGLNNWCNLKNESIVYVDDGGFEIALQLVDDLGIFIEAEEDSSIANLSEEQKLDYLKNKIAAFGFKLGDDYSCKKPYMILHSNIG